MTKGLLAIIGGTGVDLCADAAAAAHDEAIATRFGIAHVSRLRIDDRELILLKRHARPDDPTRHDVPPHRVNYRANIAALKKLSVTGILASTAVGSLRTQWPTGTLVLLDQFIDCTTGRAKTFFDDVAVHIDVTEPFCPILRSLIRNAATDLGIELREAGTYLCCDGPRFETAAEIRAYARWNADVVGMTLVPEVVLAREANISYAGISVVSNLAAGLGSQPLSHTEVVAAMRVALPRVTQLFMAAARAYRDDPTAASRNVTTGYLTDEFDPASMID